MLQCPHCAARITLADLYSRRLLQPRTCQACGRQYFEGGTTLGMALVGVGGAIATSISSATTLPGWVAPCIAFGFAAISMLFTNYCQPRRVEELPAKLVLAVAAGIGGALLTWALVAMAT